VKKVKIIRDKISGNPMGYGFLEFENKSQAEEALQTLKGKILPKTENKTFKLNWASYNTNKSNSQNPNEFSIYVCELDPSVNEEILTNFFKQKYKSVINSKIIVDPSTKISKGYGFVKFSDKYESEKAISEMNGQTLNGKNMKTGTASYKKNEKKQNNFFNDLSSIQNDPNFLMQQQQYLNQFYLSNGYLNPYYYQIYQLMNQNLQNSNMFNMGINPELNLNDGNDQNMINQQQYQQGQDINQLFNNLALLNQRNNANNDNMEQNEENQ
jgi:RNA recognition motif-containing protein